jgi:type IV pilus assembly protein PilQ
VNLAAEQKVQMEQKPAASTGSKYTGEPISVNLKDVDLKDFFRLIHEISGLNVVLDPQVHGNLTIVLDDVPWDQALDIVLKNNDLSRQLDGNVLRIATIDTLKHEAENRRAQIDAEALAVDKVSITRFLSYAHAKDVILPVKKFLSQRGDVVADERTNSLIVSDIPAVLPQIDRIIQQMDRKTQEVEIEARVVAATRSFARDIGTQLGMGWGNGTTSVGGAPNVGSGTAISNITNPLYYSSGGAIPLFSNLGATGPTSGLQLINATNNMRIDVILTAAESRGLLKVLSRPRVVTQNNIQAVVKQGVKVPIVTAAQLGGPPTTSYVDAFLRLTVTPQITSEGTIFLNVDVENTLPDFSVQVQGNPELVTQQATTQVLVTDGGTVVIGGVIQTNNSLSVSQVPLLGDIPYLGQPVQASYGEHYNSGADFLHHSAHYSDISFGHKREVRTTQAAGPSRRTCRESGGLLFQLLGVRCRLENRLLNTVLLPAPRLKLDFLRYKA